MQLTKQPAAKGHHAARTAKGAAARHASAAKPVQDTSSAEVEGLTPAEVLVKYRELKAENDRLRQELKKKQVRTGCAVYTARDARWFIMGYM